MLYIYFDNITFNELAKELQACLIHYGINVEITSHIDENNFMDIYIIFGMNDFSSQTVPHNYIVFQLEQTTGQDESKWFSQTYINHMKNALEIWDYSLINYQNLRKVGIEKVKYVPLQYMRSIDNIQHQEKDIDILFYGSVNERRQKILDQLTTSGLKTVVKTHVWNEERDNLIARSKIVVNIHYYNNSILETTRLSYLLSNSCLVVSEKSQDPVLDKWHTPYLKFVCYDQLVETCQQCIDHYQEIQPQITTSLLEYKKHPFYDQIPFDVFKKFQCFTVNINTNPEKEMNSQPKPPIIDSHDLFEAEQEITPQQELILKLPKLGNDELPNVSVVTVTYNRKNIFPMAVRNWELFEYPRNKLEWVIVDDSDDGSKLSGLLPKTTNIKYYRLKTTGRLSIGQKRNFGVKNATNDYIVFMDDDDYYYPCSVYARIALLLKYPKYDLVGVTDLDIYDVVNNFSAKVRGSLISEASMAFKKSFWEEQNFPDKFNTLGEGYPFTKDRRNRIIKMPSCFNIIALTHWSNYTQHGRSYDKFKNVAKKDNILSVLDLQTKLFIFELFDKIRKSMK